MLKNIQHKFIIQIVLLLALTIPSFTGIATEEETPVAAGFEQTISLFSESGFKQKELAIKALSKVDDKRVLPVFKTMLAGRLYFVKASKRIVFIEKKDDGYRVTSADTNQVLAITQKSKLKKISVNNKLRRILRGHIAALSLKSPDADIRIVAVKEIIKNVSEQEYLTLSKLAKTEQDEDILELVKIGIAMWELDSDEQQKRLAAIKVMSESLLPEVKVKLVALTEKTSSGDYVESDDKVRRTAARTLAKIDERISFFGFLDNVVFGLSLGSVLLLIAIGLAITFGVMGVINMAHGELMMIGAYTTFVVQQLMPSYIGMSVFISIPLAFLVSAMFGIAIERFVIRYMYGRPLETLLATFGISLMLQQLVRVIFGPTNQAVETPPFMSGSLEINPVFAITYNRLYIFVFSIMVLLALIYILKKTRLGLQVRAVSQNRAIARAMGIRSEWVDALTFGLGAGIAGIAGVALSQLTNVGPNLGQGYIIDSFMVVVFGGVGNLWGTLVAAMSLGVISKFLEPWAGAVLAKILVLVFIILFIQKRPRGLFPQKGRAAES